MKIFFCKNCKVPIISLNNSESICGICKKRTKKFLTNDMKPLFPLEKKNKRIFIENAVFVDKYNIYLANGEKISLKKVNKSKNFKPLIPMRTPFDTYINFWNQETEYEKKIIAANFEQIKILESEAIEFIKRLYNKIKSKFIFVTFSGGKDSQVVALLAQKAIPKKFKLLFIDTTIELPQTYKFVQKFSKENNFELVISRAPTDFYNIAKILGPPSRLMKWCCTTQKATAVNLYYQNNIPKGEIVLTFDGIRHDESRIRSGYSKVNKNTKIAHNISCYPIFNWNTFAVWLYLLYRKSPPNHAYFVGLNRIGCYPCPNNADVTMNFIKYIAPNEMKKLNEMIIKFGEKNGKQYIENSNWKQRKPHYFNKPIMISPKKEILIESERFWKNFDNQKNILFLEKMIINKEKRTIIILIEDFTILRKIAKGLTRIANCINCFACLHKCKINAITYTKDKKIIITNKCVKCMKCLTKCPAKQYNNHRIIFKIERNMKSTIKSQ